jgi:ribosomal protein RSM22 (predicted rRNA methylase)
METLPNDKKNDLQKLAANVARLSKLLTRDRGDLAPSYLKDPCLRKAYTSYFLPANIHKIHTPLRDLALHPGRLFENAKLRILDIGSGPGTAVLGVMEFFSGMDNPPELEFIAVDQVPENLTEAETLFAAYRNSTRLRASLRTIRATVARAENLPGECFDMIILSNVLNELVPYDEEKIVKRVGFLNDTCSRLLADKGSCIIIEPALRETSRDMLNVRDELLECGLHPYSPCLLRGKCPALMNPKDWCHEDVPWTPPAIIQEVDRLTGLRKDSLKFSYLVLRKDAVPLSAAHGKNVFRIVSEPLASKGKVEFYVCGPLGRRLIIRFDKDRTPTNHLFETMRRGNVVNFEELTDEGKRLKVEKTTNVLRLF